VLEEGWKWRDSKERSYKISLQPEDLSDHIRDVDDSILQEVIGCAHAVPPAGGCNEQCATAFRLTAEELAFYRKMNIALPRLCVNCRYIQRLKWRNGYHLYKRKCMCNGATSDMRQGTRDKGIQKYSKTFSRRRFLSERIRNDFFARKTGNRVLQRLL